ncbi:Hsp70 family protein [Actinoplanes sp. NPDC051411]|uniref:Hsp70 family protein n=1 Tax=Actinoplanes sp. NPDC051411 TaxID=3155522 RepID=UPI003437B0B0
MSIDRHGPQPPKRHALGVDFGTSNTVAVARWPDGRARPILVDGSPLLPSAVYAEPSGALAVGRDAVHSARLEPARFEPNPKRRIDDGLVLLGENEIPVVDLIAAVLARVAEEWHRAVGPVRPDVTLTCPATWGAARRTLLAEAAAMASLEGARLVAEPVAAATYFAEVLGRDVPIGSVVVVHDFGAGTFDASVVARTAEGFEVMAVDGRDDIGGLDVDAAIVEHLRTPEWQRLMEPSTVEERRAQRQLWDDVRIAKERLSRAQAADFVVPLLDVEAHLTRDELERVARPVLDQTVQVTKGLLNWADLPPGRLAGVFLVGGASRIPLVATLLHRALGEAPVVIEQPELVVAEGSILADAALLAAGPSAPGPTAELKLVSSGRADGPPSRRAEGPPDNGVDGSPATTARGPQNGRTATATAPAPVHLPGTTGLQPPVDPWPNADHGWVPDPDATVPTPRDFGAPAAPPGVPPKAQAAAPRPMSPAASPTRPVSPSPQATGKAAAPVRKPQKSPPAQKTVKQPRPARPKPSKPPRRPGRFVRFLQILLSIIMMIAVPLVALLLAYGWGNGEPIKDDAVDLVKEIADLLGIRS